MITLISAISGIPTSYPFVGYGGIERIVADLAHTLNKMGHGVTVVAYNGSCIPGVEIIECDTESDVMSLDLDGTVIDFTHTKSYLGDKYSVPFWSDREGADPIFPTNAVRWALGHDAGKVIYPGIDLSRYTVGDKQDYYLFMSRIAPYKGVHEAIYIARKLGIRLLVAGHTGKYGDPSYANWIKEQCGDGIEWVGDVSDEEKNELLSHASGLIFLPMWEALRLPTPRPIESFGIVAIEAIASGTPVITESRMNGHIEIIRKTNGGLVVSDANWNRIKGYHPDPKRLSKNAKFFSSERYATDLLKYIGVKP